MCFYSIFFPEWLYNMTVKKLVVVIKDVDTNEVLERWQFDVEGDKEALKDGYVKGDKFSWNVDM